MVVVAGARGTMGTRTTSKGAAAPTIAGGGRVAPRFNVENSFHPSPRARTRAARSRHTIWATRGPNSKTCARRLAFSSLIHNFWPPRAFRSIGWSRLRCEYQQQWWRPQQPVVVQLLNAHAG